MTTFDEATRAQVVAAAPSDSTWLSANAGSGKTRVLTERVARLLLRKVDPQRILCLTYTRAAAAEMQNRLFKQLGEWAMLDDACLAEKLSGLGETEMPDPVLARTLFARAVETPGGLKIQTIHAFCSALLRRFPLEAGVSPRFGELDEAGQKQVVADVLDAMAGARPAVLDELARHFSGEDLAAVALRVAGEADRFPGLTRDEIFGRFGISPNLTVDDVLAAAPGAADREFLRTLPPVLQRSEKSSDQKLANQIERLPDTPGLPLLDALCEFCLFKEGQNQGRSRAGRSPTKDFRAGDFAPYTARFDAIMDQVETARRLRVALDAASATWALHAFAAAFLPAYRAEKERRGVLDFDDLVHRARALLTERSLEWVLYRLDGGLDHVLVDEAQDTSPAQWQVIQALTREITAGEGARGDTPRTVFVVGDKKQSIYSFQGADAQAFDTVADSFARQLAGGRGLQRRELIYSFRSSPAILRAVDAVFQGPVAAGLGGAPRHAAFHEDLPGRVDVWALEPRPDRTEDPDWHDPVDRLVRNAPEVLLADRVARKIGALLEKGTVPGENGAFRRITPGDILILVQRRGPIFDQIIRACKAAGLPMAGADRLKIAGELAVRDLLALLSFLALPEDDLSLAVSLRSPLFGWSEAQLYDLARGRSGYLWAALRDRRDEFPETWARLRRLRDAADFLRPYELLETVLTGFGGRRLLLERLGPEAEDGIDELLGQALAHEDSHVPTLTGFLTRAHADDIEIKRPLDSSGDVIRVMTVHRAKGLESSVVILPDTTRNDLSRPDHFVITPDDLPIWNLPRREAPDEVIAARQARDSAAAEERQRLLYVAMTRAKHWLIVTGIAPRGKKTSAGWHAAVEEGVRCAGGTEVSEDGEVFLRLECGDWSAPPAPEPPVSETVSVAPPVDLGHAPPPPPATARVLSPSDLGGAKALPGDAGEADLEAALLHGARVHRLLQFLPAIGPADWPAAAARLLGLPPQDCAPILAEASATIRAYPAVFADDTLAEVDLAAHLPALGSPMAGTVDRLVMSEERVLAVDFKTNAVIPASADEVPEGILRQMGAYLAALEQVWPARRIELAIIWTKGPTLMAVEHGIVREALARATTS